MIDRGMCVGTLLHTEQVRGELRGACKMGVYSRAVDRKGTQVSVKTDSLSRKQS